MNIRRAPFKANLAWRVKIRDTVSCAEYAIYQLRYLSYPTPYGLDQSITYTRYVRILYTLHYILTIIIYDNHNISDPNG